MRAIRNVLICIVTLVGASACSSAMPGLDIAQSKRIDGPCPPGSIWAGHSCRAQRGIIIDQSKPAPAPTPAPPPEPLPDEPPPMAH